MTDTHDRWENAIKYAQKEQAWAKETAFDLMEMANLKPGTKILDLACGQGLVAINLALVGLDIEGRDLSLTMLKYAREHCEDAGAKVNFLQQDILKLEDQSAFDVLMLLDVVWGVFSSKENRELLKKFGHALRPNGTLILEVYNKTVAQKKEPLEGLFYYDSSIERFSGESLSIEVLTLEEWQELLLQYGFSDIQFVPALAFRKRGLEASQSLINYIIATKV